MLTAPIEPLRYLTDGSHLYEVVNDQIVRNFGLAGGMIRNVVLRECVTEQVATVDELHLAALAEVRI